MGFVSRRTGEPDWTSDFDPFRRFRGLPLLHDGVGVEGGVGERSRRYSNEPEYLGLGHKLGCFVLAPIDPPIRTVPRTSVWCRSDPA